MHHKPVRIIDHEPIAPAGPEKKPFGKRHRADPMRTFARAESASAPHSVTDQFFRQRGEEEHSDFESMMAIDRPVPWKALAGAAALALLAPALAIQLSAYQATSVNGVDPITTAGIPASASNPRFRVEDVELTRFFKNGDQVMTIRGRIANHSAKITAWPELIIQIYDSNNIAVQKWHHRPGYGKLDEKESFRFYTSAIDPTGRAERVSVAVAR